MRMVRRARTVREVVALASPVVVTELGGITLSTIDIFVVSHLGPEAIAAVGIGNVLFLAVGALGVGFQFSLDTLVSQAIGARRLDECHRWLVHGVFAAVVLAALLWAAARLLVSLLPLWGLNPGVHDLVASYLEIASWGYLPLFLYQALRRYLQAMSVVVPTAVAMTSALGVMLLADWMLVFGHLGAPALGTDGAAWAANITRTYLFLFLACVVVLRDRWGRTGLLQTPLRIGGARMRRMARLGLPAGAQFALELGVFAAASALAGRLDPASAAAHQIGFSIAATTFVVTLGVAGAAAVLVGQSVGRRDASDARRSGWTALALAAGFMASIAVIFVLAPEEILGLFTQDPTVIARGVPVLLVAASFQLFDGVQVVATGNLRGLGDTRTPMLTNLVAHWLVGLPIGYVLCFVAGYGVTGLWIGLSAGLALVAITLLAVWTARARSLEQRLAAPV